MRLRATPPRCYHEATNPKTPNTAITNQSDLGEK
nr:MAG TPA: hypothetical protein [Caudoviricetes sp.]